MPLKKWIASPASAPNFDYAALFAFVFAVNLPFLGKAYTMDEPVFLAVARQIAAHPLHPLAFGFNWYGELLPAAQLFMHSVLVSYLMAPLFYLTRGSEALMRLALLPVDLASAGALYWLASRFLKKPLLPTLVILATPSFFINMPLLMAEKWIVCLTFLSLCAMLRAEEQDEVRWELASAGFAALAIMIKHTAVFLPLILLFQLRRRRVPFRRIAACMALVAVPVLIDDFLLEPWRFSANMQLITTSDTLHHLRSFLSFIGGCGVVTLFWPYARAGSPPWRYLIMLAACLAAALLLFSPFSFPADQRIRVVDRAMGIFLSCSALMTLARLFEPESRKLPGWSIWMVWILADAGMLLAARYYISARSMMFLLPPLILALAARLEAYWDPALLRRVLLSSLAGTLALTAGLAYIDARYAGAQRDLARQIKSSFLDQGRTVWILGHWGFQYYLEGVGARSMDAALGGWGAVKPGDIVVAPRVNTVVIPHSSPVLALHPNVTVESAVPLRLMNYDRGQAGFYSDMFGFLPYSISREPIDEFRFGVQGGR
ncbi:MAG: ArnT family glycosyltransferase [Elusimicrobiota bacterium]